jgi:GTPase involved in cell partitioning and DNA repair
LLTGNKKFAQKKKCGKYPRFKTAGKKAEIKTLKLNDKSISHKH